MSRKILITILHDLAIFCVSFFMALWIRLDFGYAVYLFSNIWIFSLLFATSNIVLLNYFGLYHDIWRYASMHEIISILKSISICTLLIIAILFLILRLENIPRSFPILLFIISLFGVTDPRIFYRLLKDKLSKEDKEKIPVLLVGDNDTSENFIRLTKTERASPYNVIGIIGTKDRAVGRRIHNIPIVSSINNLKILEDFFKGLAKKDHPFSPQRLIVADHNLSSNTIESLYVLSKKYGLAIGKLPKISSFSINPSEKFSDNPIVIEDVLGRKQKVYDHNLLKDISNKTVLVTGAGGSIGSELCRQINSLNPKLLILLEANEHNLYKISYELNHKTLPTLTDIKDFNKVEKLLKIHKPDIVFHAAALKHITFVEDEPVEALKTNFLATVKLCQLCKLYEIKKLVFISTDKAVNPTNIMGATKRLCEKYIQRIAIGAEKTIFSIVRFGNVLGSTGSVVPLFKKQIQSGGPLTITDPKVSRYFMTIREAVELVLISSQLKSKNNGEIFILEMGKSVLIKDLAKRMILLSGKNDKEIEIKYTGLRKGEKLSEELSFENEKVKNTGIEGIMSTSDCLYQSEVSNYNNLISQIQNNKIDESMNTLKKLLPEYKFER